jgi:hypothetical protein
MFNPYNKRTNTSWVLFVLFFSADCPLDLNNKEGHVSNFEILILIHHVVAGSLLKYVMNPEAVSALPFALSYPPDKLGYICPYPFEVVERRVLIGIPQGDTHHDELFFRYG